MTKLCLPEDRKTGRARFGHRGRRATTFGVGRPGLVSKCHQTWLGASTLTQEPKGSPIHPIDPNGGSGKPRQVAQSNTSKDESITGGRKFQLRPNFVPMRWRTVDEVNRLKTDGRCARGHRATPSHVRRRPTSTKPPQIRTHARKHNLEQRGALIYGGLRSV
jgi:hypothetical protein